MTIATATATKTISRQITLCRNEQDCYTLQIALPDGVTVEQVDAELVEWQGRYAIDRSDYAWDTGTMACGAVVTNIDESRDDCPELECGPVVRNGDLNLVPGSEEWPGLFRKGMHVQVLGSQRELIRQALLAGNEEQQALAPLFAEVQF
jgi:hypothetical protein